MAWSQRNKLIHGVNVLLDTVDRKERVQYDVVHDLAIGRVLNTQEKKWIEDRMHDRESWYPAFKRSFTDWLQTSPITNGLASKTIRTCVSVCTRIARCSDRPIDRTTAYMQRCVPTDCTVKDIGEALVRAILESINDPNSLVMRKRGHRSGDVSDLYKGAVIKYHTSCVRLLTFLGLPVNELISRAVIKRQVDYLSRAHTDAHLMEPVNDVMTADEMSPFSCLQMDRIMAVSCDFGVQE